MVFWAIVVGKITESVLFYSLEEGILKEWSFYFFLQLRKMKETLCLSVCATCVCVFYCDSLSSVHLVFWLGGGRGNHLPPFTASPPLLYTRVQLQFLQDSSQAFHTKIVQIKRKSTGSLKTMVCTQDRVGTVGSPWNEARLPSFRGQMQLWQRRAGYLYAGFGSTFVWI